MVDKPTYPLPIWYHPIYTEGIHPDARFPRERYNELISRLKLAETRDLFSFNTPTEATRDDLIIGHDPHYVDHFLNGTLEEKAVKRIGLTPWTPQIIPRTLLLMGGAIAALNHVAKHGGVAGNMAGGTHHAHYDFGSGYCIFNDLAVCSLIALERYKFQRVAILDLDVHQGDGTATILQGVDNILTISLHCQTNFPFRKAESNYDLTLPQGAGDEDFLNMVKQAIVLAQDFKPDLLLFQGGVDGLATDALGKIKVSREGMEARNRLVFDMVVAQSIPTVVFMGGGYSKPISHTIDAFQDLFISACSANNELLTAQMEQTTHSIYRGS